MAGCFGRLGSACLSVFNASERSPRVFHRRRCSGNRAQLTRRIRQTYLYGAILRKSHLVLRQPGICDPSESTPAKGSPDVEVRCNTAAGLVLVPDNALSKHPAVARVLRGADVLRSLDPLARTFAVSRQVIITRLLQINAVNVATFRQTMAVLQEQYEEQQKQKKNRKVIVRPSTKAVSQLGKKFVSDALAAHERGRITDADLSEYLGVRLQHLDRIQELVGVG